MPDLEGYATIPRSVQRDESISWKAKLVYLALSSRSDARHRCWPSLATIAKESSQSEASAKRALRELRALGLVSWSPHPDGKPGMTVNIYTIGGVTQTPGQTDPRSDGPPGGVTQTPGGGLCDLQTNTIERAPVNETSRPEVEALCNLLADEIEANGSNRPEIGKGWLDAARLMLDRDGRTVAQVEACIRWCQADEFWRGNVLSMPTLRKQYDRLRLAASKKPRTTGAQATVDRNRENLMAAARRAGMTTDTPDYDNPFKELSA